MMVRDSRFEIRDLQEQISRMSEDVGGLPFTNPESRITIPGPNHTLRVATAGGTREARIAGPSTASCPSAHKQRKPTGT